MKRILVTGINGFVGKHLVRELVERGQGVIGLGHAETTPHPEIASLLMQYYQCDVTIPDQVAKLPLETVDAVINLAGLANVGASFDNPELYMRVNVDVLRVLGEALLEKSPHARMIAVSTGALYDPNQPMPLNESSSVITSGSPYSLSKLAMEDQADKLRQAGQDCIVVRPFNHIGPGQGPGFLIPDLIQKLQSTDSDNPRIAAGNLATIRDYTDVRDIVKAYADLATSTDAASSLYNVCSGSGHSGLDIAHAICAELGIDSSNLQIDVDPSLVRPTDPAEIVGDSSRLSSETGWKPTYSLQQTIHDIIFSQVSTS